MNTTVTAHAQNTAVTKSRDTVEVVQRITGENTATSHVTSIIASNMPTAIELLDLFVQSATLTNGDRYAKMTVQLIVAEVASHLIVVRHVVTDSGAARAMPHVRHIVSHVTGKRESVTRAFLASNNSGVKTARILVTFQDARVLCCARKVKDRRVSVVQPEVGDQRVKTRAMKDVTESAVSQTVNVWCSRLIHHACAAQRLLEGHLNRHRLLQLKLYSLGMLHVRKPDIKRH